MRVDHHEFRMSMGMFELTPEQITEFTGWLATQSENVNSFMDKDMSYKRNKYFEFKDSKNKNVSDPVEETS